MISTYNVGIRLGIRLVSDYVSEFSSILVLFCISFQNINVFHVLRMFSKEPGTCKK